MSFNNNKRIFNVLNYGAVPDGTTDCTAAIQAAHNAAYDYGGGTVYFPYVKNGIYLIHGALVNSGGIGIGSPNSQIYTKFEASFTGFGSRSVMWLGEAAPSPNASALANYTINKAGVVLYSDITGSGTLPAILGSDFAVATGSLNIASITIKNINFRVKANIGASGPTMSALNLSNMAFAEIDHVICDLDTSSNLSVSPTAETFGIYMPKINNGAWCPINNTLVTGYKYGHILTEHCTGNNLNNIVCEHAFVFPGAYHALQFGRLSAQWCVNTLSGPTGLIVNSGIQSQSYININQLDIEWQPSGTGNWFDKSYIVNDASNNLYGHIYYHMVKRGTGVDNSGFNKNGGTNLYNDIASATKFTTGSVEANSLVAPILIGSGVSGADLKLQSNNTAPNNILWGPGFNSTLSDLNGRVGAGLVTPLAAFHAYGNGGESHGFMVETSAANAYGAGMTFKDDSSTTWAQIIGTNGSFSSGPLGSKDLALAHFDTVGRVSLITYSALPVRIVTNSLERFTVTGAGNWTLNTVAGAAGQVPGSNGTIMGWVTPLVSPMTTLGDIIYGGASGVATRLAGNTTGSIKFLSQQGTGSVSAAPAYYDLFNALNPAWTANQTFNAGIQLGTSQSLVFVNGGTSSSTSILMGSVAGATNTTLTLPITTGTLALIGDLNNLKSYTVATLPASPNQGSIAYVTDSLTPTFLVTVVGGGSTKSPVFYNGTAWVSF